MNNPFYSIIIPAYNVEKFLSECLDSVIFQSYKDYEILLIEDKSTDSTLNIAKEYVEKFEAIKLIENKINIGLASTRNVGLKNATGKWIVFLDSDDFFDDKDFLKKLHLYCQNAECVYYGCSWYFGNGQKTYKQNTNNIEKFNKFNDSALLIKHLFNTGNLYHNIFRIACKKSYLETNKLCFDDKLRQAEDLDLFYRILLSEPNLVSFNSTQYMWRQDNSSSLTKNHTEQLKYANSVFIKFYDILFSCKKFSKYQNIILNCIGTEYAAFLIDCWRNFNKKIIWDEIKEVSKLNIFLKYGHDKKTRFLYLLSKLFGINTALNLYIKLHN